MKGRYEIKFRIIFPDGEEKVVWNEMMCIPREQEVIRNFHVDGPVGRNEDYEGDVVDLRVKTVEYDRVGKYENGSHGIEILGYVK